MSATWWYTRLRGYRFLYALYKSSRVAWVAKAQSFQPPFLMKIVAKSWKVLLQQGTGIKKLAGILVVC